MRYWVIFVFIALYSLSRAEAGVDNAKCPGHQAKLVSIQGQVLYLGPQTNQWQQAVLDEVICEGSRVQISPTSRASLMLPAGIVLRLNQGSTITLNKIAPTAPTWLDLAQGFIHFISRTPKQLKVSTPLANAGPEGTEFALAVDEHKASLWVYEGQVSFYNDYGQSALKPGESAIALANQAPHNQIDIHPQDAVNWALYYPPILPYPFAHANNPLQQALQYNRQGRTDNALAVLNNIPDGQRDTDFYKVRAEIHLAIGLVRDANQDIQAILLQHKIDTVALALQSIIALTQNHKELALTLAQKAVLSDPQASAAYTALSYAEQGHFQLENALDAAKLARQHAPNDALAWARQAELELALGQIAASEQSSSMAIRLDGELAHSQTIKGFSQLLKIDLPSALAAFKNATSLDSVAPLPRLGLGLTKIRQGDLQKGREDLEIAAILDPNNAIIRSYLGKAYFEEQRGPLASEQFKLAKERDPKDPTPYFYEALLKQNANQPIGALKDMQSAIDLNGNRGIYRSKLALDDDSATRSANFARLYNDLSFGRVALKQAWQALNDNPNNPSAHRFLSDAYIGQPRYRVARASELLKAQLLQPLNITPLQPQLTSDNIGILNSLGPGNLSLNEYDALFTRNGAHVVLNGAYGSNNTITDNAIISGIYDRLSMSLGQFHYQTDGFRANDAYQQNIYNAFAQYALTPDFNVQIELKTEDIRSEDVPFRLRQPHDLDYKQTTEQDTVRLGSRYQIDTEQKLLTSYIYSSLKNKNIDINKEFLFNIPFTTIHDGSTSIAGHQLEAQYLINKEKFNLTVGTGYLNQSGDRNEIITYVEKTGNIPIPQPSSAQTSKFYNGYVYLNNHFGPQLTSTTGFSINAFNNNLINLKQFNPKLGLIWTPLDNLALRGAVFRTFRQPYLSNQTIEPTQIVGFNQFFDEFDGTRSWQYAIGMDYRLNHNLYIGGEMVWRFGLEPFQRREQNKVSSLDKNTTTHLAYIYYTLNDWLSLKAEYHYEQLHRDFITINNASKIPTDLTTQQLPIAISLFHPNGLFAKLTGTYVHQFIRESVNAGLDKEDFWTMDTTIGYRFPKRLGMVSLEVKNLFNNHFRFQSAFDASGPQLSPYIPERQLFAKLSLFY